jgi:hypothetical protein
MTNPQIGTCKCPMWSGGGPAGLCGEPAYSEYIDGPMWWNAAQRTTMRLNRQYYSGYVSGPACPRHGGAQEDGPRVYKDGTGPNPRGGMSIDMWCAVYPDFENLQESPAAFHVVAEFAIRDLLAQHPR